MIRKIPVLLLLLALVVLMSLAIALEVDEDLFAVKPEKTKSSSTTTISPGSDGGISGTSNSLNNDTYFDEKTQCGYHCFDTYVYYFKAFEYGTTLSNIASQININGKDYGDFTYFCYVSYDMVNWYLPDDLYGDNADGISIKPSYYHNKIYIAYCVGYESDVDTISLKLSDLVENVFNETSDWNGYFCVRLLEIAGSPGEVHPE